MYSPHPRADFRSVCACVCVCVCVIALTPPQTMLVDSPVPTVCLSRCVTFGLSLVSNSIGRNNIGAGGAGAFVKALKSNRTLRLLG